VVALEQSLGAFVARARAAWPDVTVATARLAGYLVGCLPPDARSVEMLAVLDAPGLYLACACAHGDGVAIATLEAAYFDDATPSLRRMATSSSFVDDVKQAVREKLFVARGGAPAKITQFAGRGDLRTFVRVLMTREGLNLRRKAKREVFLDDGARSDRASFTRVDPELSHLKSVYGAEFERAFYDAIAELTSEERNLLRFHYLDRLNIDQIGLACGVHRASAARRLARVRQSLVEATRRLVAERLRLAEGELVSVLRLLESELDVSLRRALEDASARAVRVAG
jgi:RNA polymerase sigma-70 factor, ECF subfamily